MRLTTICVAAVLLAVSAGCGSGRARAQPQAQASDELTIRFLPPDQFLPLGDTVAKYRGLTLRGDGIASYADGTGRRWRRDLPPADCQAALQRYIDAGLLQLRSDLKPFTGTSSGGTLLRPYRYEFEGRVADHRVDLVVTASASNPQARQLVDVFNAQVEALWPPKP